MVPGSDWSHPDLDSWPGTCLILTRTGLILTRTGAMRPGRSLKYPPLRDRSLKEPTGRRRRRLLLRRSASLACGAVGALANQWRSGPIARAPGPVSERPALVGRGSPGPAPCATRPADPPARPARLAPARSSGLPIWPQAMANKF